MARDTTPPIERYEMSPTRTEQTPSDQRYQLAEEYMAAGEYRRAEAVLTAAMDRTPRAAQSCYLLGVSLAAQGKYDAAEMVIARAYDLKPWVREPSDEVVDVREIAKAALAERPDWDWAQYQVQRTAYSSVGLTVSYLARSQMSVDPTFVVQVGANDGRRGDPIVDAIVKYDWAGILIEPLQAPYESLREFHSERPKIIVENCAISDTDGTTEMFMEAGGRSTLASMKPDRNVLRNQEAELVPVEVQSSTFDTLLAKHDVETIDFLQIDTEGFDFQILKMFDIGKWRPLAINLEFYCLPLEERLEIFEMLTKHGYVWKFTGMDLLAVDGERISKRFCVVAQD